MKNNTRININNKTNTNNIQNQIYNSEKKQIRDNSKENENNSLSNKKQLIHRHNLSSNIKISIKDENKDNNNTLYENNYTIPSIEVNNTIDIYKIKNNSFIKNDNIIINKNILIKNNCIPKPIYSKKKKKIKI